MHELQIYVQRRRKMLIRVSALLILGGGGLLAVLPRADAHGPAQVTMANVTVANLDSSFLLSPEPMSAERFATLYAVAHR